MAAKKTTPKKKSSSTKRSSEDTRDTLVDAALAIAGTEGWGTVTVARLAEESGIGLGEVIRICPTPASAANLALNRIDRRVLAGIKRIDLKDSTRDRLFEMLMARFDALQDHRAGYVALVKHALRNPMVLACRVPASLHSMALMLIAAGIGAEGPIGMLRVKAVALAYSSAVRVWLKDDSDDMAQTMSALDKALSRLEELAKMTAFKPGKRKRPADQTASS